MTMTPTEAAELIGPLQQRNPDCPICLAETTWDDGLVCHQCGLWWETPDEGPAYLDEDKAPCEFPPGDNLPCPTGFEWTPCPLPTGHLFDHHHAYRKAGQ